MPSIPVNDEDKGPVLKDFTLSPNADAERF
jgi:hypothetical protein